MILITGKIVDSATKEGLPFINCKIYVNGVFNNKGFTSDDNGIINTTQNLQVGTYEFEFSFLGYGSKTITKQLSSTTTQINFGTIELDEESELLDEVEIITITVKGKVIDDKKNPLPGATIKSLLNDDSAVSQTTGDFTLNLKHTKSDIPFNISVSAEGYGSKSDITPFNGPPDNTVRRNLGPIQLNPLQVDLQDDVAEELPLEEIQVKALKASKINFEMAQQQALNQVITTAKTVLIPAILTQLAAFGITKASEAIKKNFKDINVTCPSNLEELNAAIAKKNRLVKQLNNIYKFLERVKVGVQIVDGLISAAQIALPILLATPPPGSTAVASEKIERELKKYKLISSVTLMVLVILIQILERTLAYLALLDQSIGKCAIEGALPQEQLTTDLLTSTQFQSTQLSPVVTNVNGFEMSVIDVDNVTIDGLKRRRAVARNSQGIIMLQGEPSFSSNDQILIDELVFYIQQNDLKA
jgi:hypothetical protein